MRMAGSLPVDTDRLDASLRSLDPGDRALLELSLRQRVPDEEIAELLQSEAGEVERQRQVLLERLASELEANGDGPGVDQVAAAIGGNAAAATAGGAYVARPRRPEGGAETAEPAENGAPTEPAAEKWTLEPSASDRRLEAERRAARRAARSARERSRRRAVLVALAVVALGAVVTILVAGGGDEEAEKASETPAVGGEKGPERPPPSEAPEGAGKLEPLSGQAGKAEGGATIEGSGDDARLKLSATNLPAPEGAYQVWLYDSLIDSEPVATVKGTSIELSERLPADPADYRYVDVSVEPADGNPNHSGRSVLRVPVRDLLGG
jgi:Anti-sigma-K factor rskA